MAETLRKRRSNQFLNSKNTKPELKVQRLLLEMGIFFNKHSKELAGTPDISIPSKKIILNVKGCFWHQHGCLNSKMPKTNQLFWHEKFEKIKINDIDQLVQNKDKGWTTFDLWECIIMDMEKIQLEIKRIICLSEKLMNASYADNISKNMYPQKNRVSL